MTETDLLPLPGDDLAPGGPIPPVDARRARRSSTWASRWTAERALLAVAVAVALAWTAFVAVGPIDRVMATFTDDAYYYFGVARHVVAGDGSTFNGVDLTNGYHPLWMALLLPEAAATHDVRLFLVLVTAVSGIALVGSAIVITRIARETGAGRWLVVAAVPLLVTGTIGPAYWFAGMESTVSIPMVLLLVWWYVRWRAAPSADRLDLRRALGGGTLLAVLIASRLDLVFTAAVLMAVVVGHLARDRGEVGDVGGVVDAPRRWAWALVLGAPSALFLAGYLAANRLVFATPVPVSGTAKSLGQPFANLGVLKQLLGAPVLFNHDTYLGLAAVALAVAGLVVVRRSSAYRPLAEAGAVVTSGAVLATAYYGVASSWPLWFWYFATVPIGVMCSLGAILAERPPRGVLRALVGAAVVLALLVEGIGLVRNMRTTKDVSTFVAHALVQADQIAAVVPPGGAVAMGDRAGALGFLSDRPLIQLEGLVGSREYLDALQHGDVHAFLAARHVELYLRSAAEAGEPAEQVGCTRYPEPNFGRGPTFSVTVCDADLLSTVELPDGSYYRMWRYRPELNP